MSEWPQPLLVTYRYGLVTEQKKGSYKYFMDMGDRLEAVEPKTVYIDEVGSDHTLLVLTNGVHYTCRWSNVQWINQRLSTECSLVLLLKTIMRMKNMECALYPSVTKYATIS